MQHAYNNLLFLILSLLTGFVAAQDVEQTFILGKEQMVMKHYDAASLAVERVLYFGEGKYQTECLGYLADMSMAQNETDKAIQYFGRAAVASNEPALSTWFSLRKCSSLLKQKESKLALI